MKFKPGDKVWIDVLHGFDLPAGTYAGVVTSYFDEDGWPCGLWKVDVEGVPPLRPGQFFLCHQDYMRPRDDPPPQQEPKREEVGSWDKCYWKPSVKEVA